MRKYFSVIKISFQQEFVYRLNFIMWRVRNVLQMFLVFFLWDTVFADPQRQVFGYNREKILTYIFGLLIIRGLVLSARSIEVSGEVARGELSNYLTKPVSYFKYWLGRDLSTKLLNVAFAVGETTLLFVILKPPFFLQTNFVSLAGFLIAIVLAMFIYFVLLFITGAVPLWIPEAAWGASFLVTVIFVEFMSGALYPLDVFPKFIQSALHLTPFPYLIFFPLQVYLGKIQGAALAKGLLISGFWAIGLWFLMKAIWRRGLKVYEAHGR